MTEVIVVGSPREAGELVAGAILRLVSDRPDAVLGLATGSTPLPVYEALRQIAFDERAKIHDLVMQGIEAVLRKRGYPSVDDLKSGTK